MAKRRMVLNNLQKNSAAAYFAAIEIHNKPNISFRYETTTLLLMNAWELILKAFIKKYVKNRSIFEKDGHTIPLEKALDYVEEYINTIEPKSFTAVKENLSKIRDYRNNIIHFYNEQLEPYIFMLGAKAALNYVEFQKKYFSKDILAEEGLFILPLGFKLPFRPEDFLTKKSVEYIASPEARKFINSIVNVITDLDKQGVEDSIVIGFDIYLENVKKLSNSDLLVAITNKDEADANFVKVSKYQLTADKNAQKINLSDSGFILQYPLSYADVRARCKEQIAGFKQGSKFNQIMKEIKKKPEFAYVRKHNPNSTSSSNTIFYSESCVDEIIKQYKEV